MSSAKAPKSKAPVTCHYCGAPCREEVLMRGGEHGWGDDASRTVQRYVAPHSAVADVAGSHALAALLEAIETGCMLNTIRDRARDVRTALSASPAQGGLVAVGTVWEVGGDGFDASMVGTPELRVGMTLYAAPVSTQQGALGGAGGSAL